MENSVNAPEKPSNMAFMENSSNGFFFRCLFWEKERGRTQAWEGKREKIPNRLDTVSAEPDMGLDLSNHEIMTWVDIKSWMFNQLSQPGAPDNDFFNAVAGKD